LTPTSTDLPKASDFSISNAILLLLKFRCKSMYSNRGSLVETDDTTFLFEDTTENENDDLPLLGHFQVTENRSDLWSIDSLQ